MEWTPERYARIIVHMYGLCFRGYPEDLKFENLSDIKGGLDPIQRLLHLWEQGILRFEEATPKERQRALHDPESVLPGARARHSSPAEVSVMRRPAIPQQAKQAAKRLRELAAASPPSLWPQPPSTAEERVLYPLSMLPVFSRPLDIDPPAAPRRMRSDFGKTHKWAVPTARALYPKVGPLTSHFIVEPSSDSPPRKKLRIMQVDDPIDLHTEISGKGDELDSDIESWTGAPEE